MRVVPCVVNCSICCLFFVLFSCNSEVPKNTGPIGEVSALDSVVFHLDKGIISPLKSAGAYQYIYEKNQLAYLNTYPRTPSPDEKQNIKFFDFDTGEVVNTIVLGKRGGHGFVAIPTNFYYQSEDSIWVYPARIRINDKTEGLDYHELGLVNSKGQVEMRPSLIPKAIRSGMSRPMSARYGGISRRGRELIVSSQIMWGRRKPATPFYTLDIRSARASTLDFRPYREVQVAKRFRNKLNNDKGFSEVRSVLNNKDELVSNFPLDHYLSVIGKDGDVERVAVRSRHLIEMPDFESEPEDNKALEKRVAFAGYYVGVLYDIGNDQYYRITRLSKFSVEDAVRYTVMVINNNFELIAETEFNGDHYLFEKGLFVAQGGLFVLLKPNSSDKMIFVKLGMGAE